MVDPNPCNYDGSARDLCSQERGPCSFQDRHGFPSVRGPIYPPKAAVSDIAHGIVFHEVVERSVPTRNEKTGTPMFRSLELTFPASLDFDSTMEAFDELVDIFEELEKRARRAHLDRAFPRGPHGLADAFKVILAMERTRRAAVRRGSEQHFVPADPPHAPRHDAESFYWILLWALGRALPRRPTEELRADFNYFCTAMVEDGSADPCAGNRKLYIRHQNLSRLLHPQLKYLEFMLQVMSAYFLVPWHLYPQVGHDHAHSAMHRILLSVLLDAGSPVVLAVNVNLAEQPRPSLGSNGTLVPSVLASNSANVLDATRVTGLGNPSPCDHTAASRRVTGAKRPLDEASDDDDAASPGSHTTRRRQNAHLEKCEINLE